jgi:dienelactone hydrolase
MPLLPLSTGAEARVTNGIHERTVVLVNGGQRALVPGTWSATLEWLTRELAPRFPRLGFVEVRYRTKSWQQLDACIADAVAAVALAVSDGASRCALLGFSMGGAVSSQAVGHEAVTTMIGLAPWFPDRLGVQALAGKRLAVFHGGLDRYLPGIPGVSPVNSRAGFDRALAVGAEGDYTLIEGGVHGVAVRAPWGLLALPRARTWRRLIAAEIERFQASE